MPPPRELSVLAPVERPLDDEPGPDLFDTASDAIEDELLVRRAQAGDDEAFGVLYRRHRETLYAICLKRLRDPATAEDVVQDTFLRAHACLDRLDLSRRVLPWLVAIAVRRCTDVHRRNGRTSASDDLDGMVPGEDGDPTLDAVLLGDERRRLERALRKLHPRQRRALLLYALEGWSYADIASAEGISIASTKSLLFHARENLRRSCRRGLFAGLFVPVAGIRARLRRAGEELRVRAGAIAEPVAASVAPVSSGVAAVVLTLTSIAAPVAPVARAPGAGTEMLASAPSHGSHSGGFVAAYGAARRPPRGLAENLLDPTEGATPENTQFTSVAPSPNYQQDHTLVAAGRVTCPQTLCSVLFVSRDSGASWVRIPTREFYGVTILLPPSYPTDPRIFAMGPSGLQVAPDGSDFEVVLPIEGDAALSPLFDGGEERILIGATVITEYWADTELVKPATLLGPAGKWLTVAFSPDYVSDKTIFVGGIRPDTGGVLRPTVNRCTDSVCESLVFETSYDAPWIRPSMAFSRDRTVYAFTTHALFRSVDAGTTFTAAEPEFATRGMINDVLVTGDGSVLVATTGISPSDAGVHRSSDGGATWTKLRVPITGFEAGSIKLVGLADGRLIALGAERGIACSEDGGRTWMSRCGSR